MQTITFYAYKGGTGRTLALANAAKYLARLGQKVFAVDLDLEAPGLHHKLLLNASTSQPQITQGVVDCIYSFAIENRIPNKLAPFTVEVPSEEDRDGKIILMPAGNVVAATYWRRLAELNWHEMFYKEGAEGVLFFLELKERIRAEFSPDFLLIDARTGITEIGGVATTVLPDQVVCLLLNNRENLEGAREVLRGIIRVSQERKRSIGILPVLARLPGLPRRADADPEWRIAESVRAFLSAGEDDRTPAIDLPAISVLHAEESLGFQESLRIGSTKTADESPLLRDYLRLFAQIIPSERVEPHLDRLVESATKELLEKPDRVQSDLEALATYCPHPTSYLALLKFYRLRNAPSDKLLQTAVHYWELSRRSDQPLLRDIVSEHFKPERRPREGSIPMLAGFVEAVWDAQGGNDPDVGLRLVDQFLMQRSKHRAIRIIEQLLRAPDGNPQVVIGCINRLIEAEEYQQAQAVVDQWVRTLADDPDFQSVWASLVVQQRDSSAAKRLFESKDFRPASILAKKPLVYIRLLMLAGRASELDAALQNSLDQSVASGDTGRIMQTAALFDELGRLDVLKSRITESLPRTRAERILEMLSHRRERFMWHRIPGDEVETSTSAFLAPYWDWHSS